MTFTTRSSNCTSCGDGVFCSLLRIPSEVSAPFAFLGVRSKLLAGLLGIGFGFCQAAVDCQKRVLAAAAHVQRPQQRPPPFYLLHCRVRDPLHYNRISVLTPDSLLCRHCQLLKGRELIKYGSTVSISNHPVLFVMKGSVSMKAAVAQLGKDADTTAKVDPGADLMEKRQQRRLQVPQPPSSFVAARDSIVQALAGSAAANSQSVLVFAQGQMVLVSYRELYCVASSSAADVCLHVASRALPMFLPATIKCNSFSGAKRTAPA